MKQCDCPYRPEDLDKNLNTQDSCSNLIAALLNIIECEVPNEFVPMISDTGCLQNIAPNILVNEFINAPHEKIQEEDIQVIACLDFVVEEYFNPCLQSKFSFTFRRKNSSKI